ncbi:MAG TPA: L,D-transpeptidase [Roseovarius sp.]|mgnify:CR=1 FL=1|nr:L,D-transpeptidase [Roseovarius sp.]
MRAALTLLLLLAWPVQAAQLEARIDLSDQEMTVVFEGEAIHHWPVSSARAGKFTPTGLFHVQVMKRMHYSTLYDNAPMPFSIFFSGNFAIHGTTQVDRLGNPASAGCIRLHPENAEALYNLIRQVGRTQTLIEIVE